MIFQLLILFCINNFVQNIEIPKQIHILFRHGERSPTSTYPNDPHKDHKWSGGFGHLTNRGKMQVYTLGQNLRSLYKDFFPLYYWSPEVNFTSSYAERCLMSAELVAAGLFPPQGFQIWNSELLWQPIPINYLPRNMDNLIAMKSNCSKYDREFLEIQNSTKVQELNKEYYNLYNYLTENTGMTIKDIEAVESLYNTLEIEQLNNLTLPQWVNYTILDQMKLIAAQNLAIYSESDYMKRVKGGFFLKTILNLMKRELQGSKVPHINMYAGHDLTIVHVLRALNLVDTIKPDFGASLIFELYDNSTFKVFYLKDWQASPQEQILKKCNNPCTVEKFNEGFKVVLPEEWFDECQLQE